MIRRLYGIGVQAPWTLTPGEAVCAINERSARDDDDARAGVTQAWITAALTRSGRKRLPSLKSLLKRRGDAKTEYQQAKQDFETMTKEQQGE